MSGFGDPARTPTDTSDRATTVTLPDATEPCVTRGSINGVGNNAASNDSPLRILSRTTPAAAYAEVTLRFVQRSNPSGGPINARFKAAAQREVISGPLDKDGREQHGSEQQNN